MSIQVLSPAALNSSLNPAVATSDALPGDAAGNGFADLLAQQMLAPTMISLDPQGKTKVDPDSDAKLLIETEAKTDTAADDLSLLSQALPWLPQGTGMQPQQTPDGKPMQERGNKDGVLSTQLKTLIGEKLAATPEHAEGAEHAAPLRAGFELPGNRTPVSPDALTNRGGNTPAALSNETGKAAEQLAANFADSKAEAPTTTTHAALHSAPTQAAKEASAPITTPMQDPRWATDFGQKVVWIARAEQQNAQININPPQLGPIQISINLNGDNASASFASPHAEVRQAIETALPRLREMLADAGINLGQANVGSQFAQQQNAQEQRQAASESPRFAVDKAILSGQSGVTSGTTVVSSRGQGLVDLFA